MPLGTLSVSNDLDDVEALDLAIGPELLNFPQVGLPNAQASERLCADSEVTLLTVVHETFIVRSLLS